MKMDEELAALADGTLAPERHAAVLRRVALVGATAPHMVLTRINR